MNLATFKGYPVTLKTPLSVEACRERLQREFYSPGGYWQHAATDKQLLGWQEGADFVICPTWRFDPSNHNQWLTGRRSWDTSRVVQLRIRQHAGFTLISGQYGFAGSAGLEAAILLGLPLGIIFGLLMLIGGLLLSFQNPNALWLFVIGATLLGGCILVVVDSSDGGFPRERDYIVRYMERVLEAQPVSEVAKRGKVRDTRKSRTSD